MIKRATGKKKKVAAKKKEKKWATSKENRLSCVIETGRVSLWVSVCVWQREALRHFPWGGQDRDQCQWVKSDTSFTSSVHTHTHTHPPDPVNRTHRGTVSDRQQQTMKPRWDSHPPEGQYKGVSLSLTHTHTHSPHPCLTNSTPSYSYSHSWTLSLSLSLSLRHNGRVSHTSGAELAVASSPCQGKQSWPSSGLRHGSIYKQQQGSPSAGFHQRAASPYCFRSGRTSVCG